MHNNIKNKETVQMFLKYYFNCVPNILLQNLHLNLLLKSFHCSKKIFSYLMTMQNTKNELKLLRLLRKAIFQNFQTL